MTPNTKIVWDSVHRGWPDVVSWGTQNCRKIANKNTWSQHSWANAWDITSPPSVGQRVSSNPKHMAYLDEIYRFLVNNRDKFNIRFVLWRTASHWDHIHVDFWPYGYGVPPCAGGSLQVKYRDGTIGSSFTAKGEIVEVLKVQESLNKAGFKGKDGNPLEEDGKWGPNTEYAYQARDRAAFKSIYARKIAARAMIKLERIKQAWEGLG